jgi:hypothetical protein
VAGVAAVAAVAAVAGVAAVAAVAGVAAVAAVAGVAAVAAVAAVADINASNSSQYKVSNFAAAAAATAVRCSARAKRSEILFRVYGIHNMVPAITVATAPIATMHPTAVALVKISRMFARSAEPLSISIFYFNLLFNFWVWV